MLEIDLIAAEHPDRRISNAIQSPFRPLTSRQTRVDLGMPGCLVMKPRRSSICIIWLTLGALTRKCRWMSASAGALPKR
jgi:hypothetical protein